MNPKRGRLGGREQKGLEAGQPQKKKKEDGAEKLKNQGKNRILFTDFGM